ncbi:hypothetical protein B0H10DRAFT_2247466 [Mycena sp. CBHHK59/15]|nr:hypothetical protein B0H10DRAFT_2247466 [Mycena sp. CBHHK59/15]
MPAAAPRRPERTLRRHQEPQSAVVPWLPPDMDPLDPESRDDRGIYNEHIGGLLCPTELNYAYEEICEGDPECLVIASSWWFGLYPHNKFDPENPEKGLFQNLLLLMGSPLVWKYIFTSPVSVKHTLVEESENLPRASDKREKRKEKAKCLGDTQVQCGRYHRPHPCHWALNCLRRLQYRVALSDQHHWEENDGSFDYVEFYNNIVDYFEFPPGPITKLDFEQLLDWWNS